MKTFLNLKLLTLVFMVAVGVFFSGCENSTTNASKARILSFTINPAVINQYGSTTISWITSGAESVTLDLLPVERSGSKVYAGLEMGPQVNLKACGPLGDCVRERLEVTVHIKRGWVKIWTIPISIESEGTVILSWDSYRVTDCVVDSPTGDLTKRNVCSEGNEQVVLSGSSRSATFTIRCEDTSLGPGGGPDVNDFVNVEVR